MYSGIFGQWAVYDADTAVNQLSFLLDSDDRNAAISGILETAYLEPDVIDQLFQRLEGAEAKRVAAEQIYHRLREDDPQSAERYRVRAGIAEEQGDESRSSTDYVPSKTCMPAMPIIASTRLSSIARMLMGP